MAKKRTSKRPKTARKPKPAPVPDDAYEVGYSKPPKEYQFKPGESGNPDGPPKHRTQLWVYFCRYMAMTDAELDKLDESKLSQSQKTALAVVRKAAEGKASGVETLAKYVTDREEGKATEHIILGDADTLTDEECEELRTLLLKRHHDADE